MSVAAGFAVNVAFYGLIFVVSVVLQRDRGYSPLATGLAFVPVMAAIMAGNVVAGRSWARAGMASGAAIMTAGCVVMLAADGGFGVLLAGLSLTGLGLGIVVPAITSAALGSVDASRSGIAAGSLALVGRLGGLGRQEGHAGRRGYDEHHGAHNGGDRHAVGVGDASGVQQ